MKEIRFEKSNVERKLEELYGGVYALFDGGECVYVGESSNIPRRLGDHIQEGVKKFNDFRIYYCRDRKTLETDLIRLLKPKYNVSQAHLDIDVKQKENQVIKDALDAFSLSLNRIVCDEDALDKIFNHYGCFKPPYGEILEKYDGYFDEDKTFDLEIALRYRKEIQQDIDKYAIERLNEHLY